MRVKGLTQSVELMLLVATVTFVVLFSMSGVMNTIHAQATSTKIPVEVSSGEVSVYREGTTCYLLRAKADVLNLGNTPIYVEYLAVTYDNDHVLLLGSSYSNGVLYSLNRKVNTGELLPVQVTYYLYGNVPSCPTITNGTIIVVYSTSPYKLSISTTSQLLNMTQFQNALNSFTTRVMTAGTTVKITLQG